MRSLAVVIIVIAAGYGWGVLAFQKAIRQARQRVAGRSQLASTSYGDVEYVRLGKGEPLLVVHGSAGGFDQGLDMTAWAVNEGFELIVPSRFGYLRSAMPAQATPAMQADAFVALLDQLKLERVTVLSISAGVWSALAFAARHGIRCRALILVVPAQPLPRGTSNFGGPIVRALFRSDLITWLASHAMRLAPGVIGPSMFGTPFGVIRQAPAQERARLVRLFRNLLPISRRSSGIAFDIATAQQPPKEFLDKIACPVLAISAADDIFGTSERADLIAASVANGSAVIFPTGGHALVGCQCDVLGAIKAFRMKIRTPPSP